MKLRRSSDRLSLPLIVVVVLSLLAFLPLALPGRGASRQPVQGYSTPQYHAFSSTAAPARSR